MLKTLHAVNFRGFRELGADLQAVTAFLGPNSSGKTTTLQAVRFACEALRLAIDADQPAKADRGRAGEWLVAAAGVLVDVTKLTTLADWQALFVDQAVGEGVSLRVALTFDDDDPVQALEVELACARNEQLKLTVRVRSSQALAGVSGFPSRSPQINQRLTQFLRDHAPVAVFVPPFYGTVRGEEHRTRAIIDRLLGSGDQSHVVRNLVVGLDAQTLERLNAFLGDTVGARITQRTSPDELQSVTHLMVQFRDTNGDIELSAAGAGLVNLVALYTAPSRWRAESQHRRVLFLLDEPEAHLHPRLQADMTERLARLVTREFGAQLLLATHSVDILNRLSSTGALLVRCDRSATPSAVALTSDAALFDDLAAWVDLTPYTAINVLAARRVVFCEGVDEVNLLPRLAALAFRNDPRRAAGFAQWAVVPLHGASSAPVAGLLAKLLRSDALRAGATFRVEVALDRDHHREVGHRVDPDGVTTTVWSRHSLESLLLEPGVLAQWVRASIDVPPDDLLLRIQAAAAAADADATLNDTAIEQLAAALRAHQEGSEEQRTIRAVREARELVRREPATWQRGKDRGRFLLGRVRDDLPHAQRRQLPTDVTRLVARAPLDRIGDPAAAIPAEIAALLERLAV